VPCAGWFGTPKYHLKPLNYSKLKSLTMHYVSGRFRTTWVKSEASRKEEPGSLKWLILIKFLIIFV